MVRMGVGVETPYGEFTIPLYDTGSDGRTVLTFNPFAFQLGGYNLEPSIAVTTGDIGDIYRRVRDL